MALTVPNNDVALSANPQSDIFTTDWDALVAAVGQTGVLSGLVVTAHGGTMSIDIASGIVINLGVIRSVVSSSGFAISSSDPSNPRYDAIVVNSSGVIANRVGTPAANPKLASLSAGDALIAKVYVPVGSTSILASYIYDGRGIKEGRPLGFVNVKDYGAALDGATDDSAAWTAAIAALPAGGGTIFLPAGVSKLQSTVTMPAKSVQLLGSGWGSIITGDANPLIAANSDPDPQTGGRLIVRSIEFDCTKTSAAQTLLSCDVTAVAGDNNTSVYVEGCRFYLNGHIAAIGLFLRGVSGAVISACVFESDGAELAIGSYRGIGIQCSVTTSTLNITVKGCQFSTLDKGVVATGSGGEGYSFTGCQFVGCLTYNIFAQSVLLLQVDNCLFDSGHGNGLDLDSCGSVYVSNSWLAPNQNGYAGISISTSLAASNRIRIVNCEIVSAAASPGNGIAVDCTGAASKALSVIGCSIRSWANGIIFGGTSGLNNIIGNTFQACTNVGIALSTGVTKSVIEGNAFDTDVVTILSGTLTTNKIANNPGYNPVGNLAGAPAVPASTVAATNTFGVDVTAYVIGTLTAITVAGVATGITAAANGVSVRVPAGSTISLTYGGAAPTWKWFGD